MVLYLERPGRAPSPVARAQLGTTIYLPAELCRFIHTVTSDKSRQGPRTYFWNM